MPVTQIPTAVLMQKPDTNGLPYAPVNKPMDLVRDPHLNDGWFAVDPAGKWQRD